MWTGYISIGEEDPFAVPAQETTELVNNARAYAYAANAGLCWLHDVDNCPTATLVVPGGPTFTSPIADPAPWFDPNEPDSWGFLGVIGLEITGGESSTRQATVSMAITGAGVIGPTYMAPRTMVVRALAIATDDCALAYGIRWLNSKYQAEVNPCLGDPMTFFECCPCVCDDETPAGPCWVDTYAQLRDGPVDCEPDWWPSSYAELRTGPGLIDYEPVFFDDFGRADGALGANWTTPVELPVGTVAVPVTISSNDAVTTADDGTAPDEWGFALATTSVPGNQYVSVQIDNVAQGSADAPAVTAELEIYTRAQPGDAHAVVGRFIFNYGTYIPPSFPVVLHDPMEDFRNWTLGGTGTSIVTGRTNKGMQLTGTSATATFFPPEATDTVIVGAAVKVSTLSGIRNLFEFYGDGGSVLLGSLRVDPTGRIVAYDATGAPMINPVGGGTVETPAGVIAANVWYYVETKWVFDVFGTVEIRVDNIRMARAVGVDTTVGGVATDCDAVTLPIPSTSGGTHTYDDVYISTTSAAAFVGDHPVANGTVVWYLGAYDVDGDFTVTTASSRSWWYESGTPIRVRLESDVDHDQRLAIDDIVLAQTDIVGALGDHVGFGLRWLSYGGTSPRVKIFDTGSRLNDVPMETDWCDWPSIYRELRTGPPSWSCCFEACIVPYMRQYHNTRVTGGPLVLRAPSLSGPGRFAEIEFTVVAADPRPHGMPFVSSASWMDPTMPFADRAIVRSPAPDPFVRGAVALAEPPTITTTDWVRASRDLPTDPLRQMLGGLRPRLRITTSAPAGRTRIGLWAGDVRVAGWSVPWLPGPAEITVDGSNAQGVSGQFTRSLSGFVRDWDGGLTGPAVIPHGDYRLTVDQDPDDTAPVLVEVALLPVE